MKRVQLGRTGIEIGELVFGTLAMGRLQANLPPAEGAKVILRGLELGIDCIDIAQLYGTYEHVALALAQFGRRADRLVVISKSHARTAQDMAGAVEECRKALRRDVIDVFHMHLIKSVEDLRERRPALEALLELKSRGVIRAVAVSVHSLAGVEAVMDSPEIEIVMPSVNSLGFGINDGGIEEMIRACRRLKTAGKGTYAMKPLGGGHLYASVEKSLKFVRSLPEVDAVAVGMKTIPELEMDVAIFEDKPVPQELRKQVNARQKRLYIYPICKGCGNCIRACAQEALTLVDGKAMVDMKKCILCGYCAEDCPSLAIRVI